VKTKYVIQYIAPPTRQIYPEIKKVLISTIQLSLS